MVNRIKIGVTQKVIKIIDRDEKVDALDQKWTKFLEECDMEIVQIPNSIKNIESYFEDIGLSGFVLSGGGDLSGYGCADSNKFDYDREKIESAIIEYSQNNHIPLIGICRGMQVLCLKYGARLKRISGHVGGTHSLKFTNNFFRGKKGEEIMVNSYHNFGVSLDGLPSELIPLATHGEYLEAVKHAIYPQIGVMWHPERNSPFTEIDVELFRSFLRRTI